ncbi:MAG: hypothetical protein ACREJD_14285 [Phycisphaerales bacterium]
MRIRNFILACAACAFAAPCVRANAPPRTFEQEPIPATPRADVKRAATIEAVRFGFDGYLLSDAWAPVRIYLSGNPNVNTGAFAGTLTIDFAQDATQSASITTTISTTPGRVTPVEIIAAIPRATPSVRLQLRNESGRVVHERLYWNSQFGDPQLPASLLGGVQMIVAIADRSGAEPSIARAIRHPEAWEERGVDVQKQGEAKLTIADRLVACVVHDEELPTSEYGFDGVAMVAARSDVLGSLSLPRAAALAAWVQSGGCLVVLAGADPQVWLRTFLPQPPIELLDSSPLELEQEQPPKARSSMGAMTGRVIRLTRPISESGWRAGLPTTKSVRHDGELVDGLLAQGPAGFGWIVVLGIDPATLGTTSADLTRNWNMVLQHALAEAAGRRWLEPDQYWRARGSGQDESARLAVRTALDSLTEIPAIGDGAFLSIVVFLLLLAVAIGPFDAMVLRRINLRAWSWATALGWIALASLLAAVIPPMIRSGNSTSGRLRVVDVVQDHDRALPIQQTALTSIFSNSTASISLVDPGRDKEPPIGWFRGASAAYMNERGGSQPLSTFETFESEIRLSDALPMRNNAPSPLEPMSMAQWTLRSFMSTSVGTPNAAPSVKLSKVGGKWIIAIGGLTGKSVEGNLRVGGDRFMLGSQEISIMPEPIEFREVVKRAPDSRWNARLTHKNSPDEFEPDAVFSPGDLLELPASRTRSRAVEALIASGGWACVELFETKNTPSLEVHSKGAFVATESTLWRILVPLAVEDRTRPLPLLTAGVNSPATRTPALVPTPNSVPGSPPIAAPVPPHLPATKGNP